LDTLLPGITAERVPTSRLTVNVLSVAGRDGSAENTPVLFVHGNVSSSLFWQPMMLALPETFRPLAIDLRGFGDTDDEPVDATRGLRDFSDDLAAAVEALGLDSVHLVGWSMGGGVVLQYLVDRPGAHRVDAVHPGRRVPLPGHFTPGGRLAGLRARRGRRAQHHGPHAFPDRRPVSGPEPSTAG
jgi:pimeloyl-ACP methyl ester carboxylesterase